MSQEFHVFSLIEREANASKLLNLDIISKTLRYLPCKDRLNLRLCSKAVERAVALSNIHVTGCCINGRNGKLSIDFRDGLKIKRRIDDDTLAELVRFKSLLFTRAIVKEVIIEHVNFNTISIAFIEELLEGFEFQALRLKIKSEEYNLDVIEFLVKHNQKKVELEIHKFALDCNTLHSLEPLQKLRILDTISKYSEQEFVDLVKQRHMLLELPVVFTSGRAIRDAIEIISAYNGQQCVHFSVNPIVMDRFLIDIGIRRTNRTVLQLNDFSDFKLIKLSNADIISPTLFMVEFDGRVRIFVDYSASVRVALTRYESDVVQPM